MIDNDYSIVASQPNQDLLICPIYHDVFVDDIEVDEMTSKEFRGVKIKDRRPKLSKKSRKDLPYVGGEFK
jgi:hypothetical protein